MNEVQVIDDPGAAVVALEPIRSRLLFELSRPASAAALSSRMGMTRQKINYHLKELETFGLVEVADRRKWGGLTEKLMVATASAYIVSPSAMGQVAVDPSRNQDRLSASYLVALAARVVREVGALMSRARETDKRLATLSIDTEIRFRSAQERAAFSRELSLTIAKLASRYHDESAAGGRDHRVIVVAHPMPLKGQEEQI